MDPDIEQQEDVTIFWDFSSTQNSSAAATISTSALVKNICSAVTPYGPLKSIQLYWDHAGYPIQPAATRIRSELSASGVCLIDCPSEGRKEGAMKKMLVDLIIHAWDHEAGPHTYVVITSDRDIAYALSRLRMKEYRIILLSPAVAHSDLTSQATIQLDWTKSILGLTGPNLGHIPATASSLSAAEAHQPSSSRLRGAFGGIYQESGEYPLPNSYVPPPGRQTSSPSLLNKSRIHSDVGLAPGAALPQTPPRASTWSMPGDPQVSSATVQANPTPSNPTPSGRTAVGLYGIPGVPFEKPPNSYPHPSEITFDPFNDPDERPRYSVTEGRRMESETPSSESTSSSASTYSLVDQQPISTAPTSAEQEWHLKPQSDTGDLGKTGGNIAIPGLEATDEKSVQSSARPIQTARVSTPLVDAPLPTTTPAHTVTPTIVQSIPTPQPSVNAPAIRPLVTQMWGPLINTLRQNGGTLSYTALPPKLLKSNSKVYVLAGRSKYKPYIQLAVESGIIVEQIDKKDPACSSIQLTAAYM